MYVYTYIYIYIYTYTFFCFPSCYPHDVQSPSQDSASYNRLTISNRIVPTTLAVASVRAERSKFKHARVQNTGSV